MKCSSRKGKVCFTIITLVLYNLGQTKEYKSHTQLINAYFHHSDQL